MLPSRFPLKPCCRVLRPNPVEPTNCCVGRFWDSTTENPASSILHTHPPCPGHVSHQCAIALATRSALCLWLSVSPEVLATMASHPTSLVPWSRLSAYPSLLSVHRHEPMWPSPLSSNTGLQTPHLPTIDQDTCCTNTLMPRLVHMTQPKKLHILIITHHNPNHKGTYQPFFTQTSHNILRTWIKADVWIVVSSSVMWESQKPCWCIWYLHIHKASRKVRVNHRRV
jgi:hypothetical protein